MSEKHKKPKRRACPWCTMPRGQHDDDCPHDTTDHFPDARKMVGDQ